MTTEWRLRSVPPVKHADAVRDHLVRACIDHADQPVGERDNTTMQAALDAAFQAYAHANVMHRIDQMLRDRVGMSMLHRWQAMKAYDEMWRSVSYAFVPVFSSSLDQGDFGAYVSTFRSPSPALSFVLAHKCTICGEPLHEDGMCDAGVQAAADLAEYERAHRDHDADPRNA